MSDPWWHAEGDAVLAWLRAHDFAGYDPFDGLESKVFASTPFARSSVARLAWLQLFKRLPINLRRLFRVPETVNPKTLGLVLIGLARRARARSHVEREVGGTLVQRLAQLRAPGSAGWGYPFAWQNRAFYAPRGTPNAVCTAFVVAGLLDYAEAADDDEAAELADSSLPFFLGELPRTPASPGLCFAYTPLDRTRIHNVNLLVAATLARLSVRCGDPRLRDISVAALRFSCARQRTDGSWPYGEDVGQGWVDSYHTGYNLGALCALEHVLESDGLEARAARAAGYDYYRRALVSPAGLPQHYAYRPYPIDVHVAAQGIVTALENLDLGPDGSASARLIAHWARATLGLGRGRYAYRRMRVGINPIVYARWGQAWMFRALAELERAVHAANSDRR